MGDAGGACGERCIRLCPARVCIRGHGACLQIVGSLGLRGFAVGASAGGEALYVAGRNRPSAPPVATTSWSRARRAGPAPVRARGGMDAIDLRSRTENALGVVAFDRPDRAPLD